MSVISGLIIKLLRTKPFATIPVISLDQQGVIVSRLRHQGFNCWGTHLDTWKVVHWHDWMRRNFFYLKSNQLAWLSKKRLEQLCFCAIAQHGLYVNRGHEVDQLSVDVEPGLAAFAGLGVHLLLDLAAHFLDLKPLLAEQKQKRVHDVLCLSLEEFSKELVIKVIVVKDRNVILLVFVVLVTVAGRLV